MRRPLSRRAFTLMEVLVALVIFALVAVMLGSAYLNVLNSYQAAARANVSNEEVGFARSQLLAEPELQAAQTGAEFDSVSGRHVKWSSTITPTETTDLFTVVFVCEVAEVGKTDTPKTTQTFSLLRPTWSDPTERTKLRQTARDRIAQLQGKK